MPNTDPLPPVPALFPSHAERVRWDDYLTRELLCANERVTRGSVVPTIDLDELRSQLNAFDFQAPVSLEELLPWTIAQLEHGVVHMTSPRYFGLFNPAPTFPAVCGDRLTGAFNPQLATATTSPAAVEIEAHVIRAVARRAGLPAESTGHFTSGGSEANCTALLCALTHANDLFATHGARAFNGPPLFYISRDSHLAWVKIGHQAGVGRSAVRQVPTDGAGRMDADALARMLEDDTARGCIPVLIVATAGTTNAGMIDPIGRCAELARDHGLWFHIDAAWGGAALASDRLRGALAGIEEADSVTIDAHKWFATTMGCGMFITRHPTILSEVFQVSTGFMPSNAASVDPYVNTAQWSRRFLGVRLFLSLAAAGWQGYAQHVERAVDLIGRLRQLLETRGWQIANDSRLAVLCVDPPRGAADPRAIVRHVLESGRAWIAVAKYEGRDVIRICSTHGETRIDDLDELVAAMTDACSLTSDTPQRPARERGPRNITRAPKEEVTSMAGSIRTTIISQFEQVATEQNHKLAELTDDRPLMDSGLDSLAFAIVVARLEDALGLDPFTASSDGQYPVTFGDFIQLYEKMQTNAVA